MAVADADAACAAASAATAAVAPTQVQRWRGLDLPARSLTLLLSLLLSLSLASAASLSGLAPSETPSPPSLPQSLRNRPTAHVRSEIIFPDSQINQYKPRLLGGRPSCAKEDSTYCEDGVEDYPKSHLNQVLDNIIGYREYFGNDTVGPNILDRLGPDGETTICRSREQVIFPKVGQTANGDWQFIVNQDDENYKQGIRVELCVNPDTPCEFSNSLPTGTNAVCRQKYIYRRLVSLTNTGETLPDSFRIPSCCACFVSSDLLTRTLPQSRSASRN